MLSSASSAGWDFSEAASTLTSPAFLMVGAWLQLVHPRGVSGYGLWAALPPGPVAEAKVGGMSKNGKRGRSDIYQTTYSKVLKNVFKP